MPRKSTPTPIAGHDISQDDLEFYAKFCTKIVANGFTPLKDLRAEFGDEMTTKAIAILFKTYRVLRENRQPFGAEQDVLGYSWADDRHSSSAMKKMPESLAIIVKPFMGSLKDKYSDFELLTARCRFVNPILGAMPMKVDGDELQVFDRDGAGNIVILRYSQRAMFSNGLPMIAKPAAMARHIRWNTIRIPGADRIEIITRPVIQQDGRTGLGLKRSESLPAGTEFNLSAMVPTTALNPGEFFRLVKLCGEFIGLSPARSAGFGDFEVLEAR